MSMDLLLGSMGADVLQADSVDKASELLNKNNIDVILSDVNRGENRASGYDFLKEVRKTNSAIPFYLVSGFSQAIEEPKAKDLGANGYIQMPIEEKQLKEILQ